MNIRTTESKKPLIIGVGELLWDLLPSGKQLGGAPANFAYHAQALGAESLVVSCVGNDELGQEIFRRFERLELRTDAITVDPVNPTGTVSVTLDTAGQPTFTIHQPAAWDALSPSPELLATAARANAVCFGSLAQRHPISRSAIRKVVESAPAGALRIFDINLRQQFWSRALIEESLELANVLKLNEDELKVVAHLLSLPEDVAQQLRHLAQRYELKAVALTKGARGSSLLVGKELVARAGSKLTVVDTIGAGDSYTAALALGLLAQQPPAQIVETAHRVADFVCTQPGAMPPMDALAEQGLS